MSDRHTVPGLRHSRHSRHRGIPARPVSVGGGLLLERREAILQSARSVAVPARQVRRGGDRRIGLPLLRQRRVRRAREHGQHRVQVTRASSVRPVRCADWVGAPTHERATCKVRRKPRRGDACLTTFCEPCSIPAYADQSISSRGSPSPSTTRLRARDLAHSARDRRPAIGCVSDAGPAGYYTLGDPNQDTP